ncbi:MAG: glutathione peroxidase [Pseudomonadota bacterium]
MLMLSTILSGIALAAANAAPQEKTPLAVRSQEEVRRLFDGAVSADDATGAHRFAFDGLMGGALPLAALKGRAVLVVNTASECGFTPQYEGLQALYDERAGDGLVVIGVPSNDFGGQEPGSAKEIAKFCAVNYGVTFPMAAKSDVTGGDAHPFYQWAVETLGAGATPKWNFHKILIGTDGEAVAAFPSSVRPNDPKLKAAIDGALKKF